MATDLGAAYLDEARRSLRGHKRLAEGAISQLRDDELLLQLDPESNSVAVLMKHIAGNIRSRFTDFLTTDGEKPDRHRDQEFEIVPGVTRAQLMEMWEAGWTILFDTISSLQSSDLQRTVTIRGEPLSVLQAMHRAVAHYAYHVGQIVYLAKHIRGAEWKSLSIPRGQSEQFNASKKSEVRSQK
jgi:uncharacterized damage-inducible protein DinB